MAYANVDDLQQAFGGYDRLDQATDWNKDRVPDDDVIARALASASSEIDSYIGKQYLVPVANPPQPLVEVCARLAKYRLVSPRGMVDEFVKDEHTDDILWLKSVRDGETSLGVDPAPTQASMRLDKSSPRPTTKDVSRMKLRGFS